MLTLDWKIDVTLNPKQVVNRIIFNCLFFILLFEKFPSLSYGKTHREQVLDEMASVALTPWEKADTREVSKAMLAKLIRNRDVQQVNDYIKTMSPKGVVGSSFRIGKHEHQANWDFVLITLIKFLYLFGDRPDRLHADSRDHLLQKLLVERPNDAKFDLTGGDPVLKIPMSGGLIDETENHILMTEACRYLKNQWLREKQGKTDNRYNNQTNGLENWLVAHLIGFRDHCFHEYNSIPYEGFTIDALMVLSEFASSPKVRNAANEVLDVSMHRYVVSELGFRRRPPINRQKERADLGFEADAITNMMWVWMDDPLGFGWKVRKRQWNRHAVRAAFMDYMPTGRASRPLFHEKPRYFVHFGRGSEHSPEIYSGGPGYLISAGGVAREASRLRTTDQHMARETMLLLDDGEWDFKKVFHIAPVGERNTWNHTGVHDLFACGKGKVRIPTRYAKSREAEFSGWQVFKPYPNRVLRVAVYNGKGMGLIALFPEHQGNGMDLARALHSNNADVAKLANRFQFPGGKLIVYDLNAPGFTWVIKSAGGVDVNRNVSTWPRPWKVLEHQPFFAAPIIHQWQYEQADLYLNPGISVVSGAAISPSIGPQSTLSWSNAVDGTRSPHLLIEKPIASRLVWTLPTTGFEEVKLEWNSRSSADGPGIQVIEYTTDGTSWLLLERCEVQNSSLQFKSFDFTRIAGVDRNSKFAVRVSFEKGEGGNAGEVRFDDVTLTGIPSPAKLVFVTKPVETISGEPLEKIVVRLVDSAGDPVVHYHGPVTLTASGSGTLAGKSTVNASRGTAEFSGLSLSGQGSCTLVARADGVRNPSDETIIIPEISSELVVKKEN